MSTLPEDQAKAYMVKLLTAMTRAGGSDLFISNDFPPSMKTHGSMQPLANQKLTAEVTKQLALSLMNQRQRDEFAKELECNFAISIPDVARFRVNVFVQQQHTGMVIRTIPTEIPSFEKLALPEILKDIVMTKRGARAGGRCHRIGQVDLVGGDDRSSQRHLGGPHHHGGGSRSSSCINPSNP